MRNFFLAQYKSIKKNTLSVLTHKKILLKEKMKKDSDLDKECNFALGSIDLRISVHDIMK